MSRFQKKKLYIFQFNTAIQRLQNNSVKFSQYGVALKDVGISHFLVVWSIMLCHYFRWDQKWVKVALERFRNHLYATKRLSDSKLCFGERKKIRPAHFVSSSHKSFDSNHIFGENGLRRFGRPVFFASSKKFLD